MRVNTAKQKMSEGKAVFGYPLGLGSAIVAEMLSDCGIDFVMIDNQHGTWGPDSTIAALIALRTGSAIPMARVARNDFTMIGRLLDEGCMGVVIPMVNNAADAKAAADACRFPPKGTRSWGWGRARAYGADYSSWIDDQIFVAVQIETVEAVENAEAILGTPGVDGCWVGPSDLSLSMGFHPSQMFERDEHRIALEKVIQACKNTGTVPGIACASPEEAVRRAEQGFRFLTAGGDAGMILGGAAAGLKTVRAFQG